MNRKELRRLQRAAKAAGMTVVAFLAWKNRELPDDHPRPRSGRSCQTSSWGNG